MIVGLEMDWYQASDGGDLLRHNIGTPYCLFDGGLLLGLRFGAGHVISFFIGYTDGRSYTSNTIVLSIPDVAVILNQPMATDKPFLHFNVEPELVKKIDDFHYKHRFKSRAAAIKWLLDAALKAKLVPKEGE